MKKLTLILTILLFIQSIPVYAADQKENRLWQDESIYSIVIDRFNDGDTNNDIDVNSKDPLAFNGGDFQGVMDKLDYIHDMGFTTIRLTPIFDNAEGGYHGYWVEDYYKTDEHFGSISLFQKLVKEAHKREMKVIIDFVANNVAPSNPLVTSKPNWFHKKQEITDWNNREQAENGWVDHLPDLDQQNPEVKKYLIDVAKWWVNKTNIDGFSLPDINLVPAEFWKDFSSDLKTEKEDFFLLGIPSRNTTTLPEYDGIDSMEDYSLSNQLRDTFENTGKSFGDLSNGTGEKSALMKATFFDNEFMTRFTNDIVENKQYPGARWKMALTYLYTSPGIPVVYYGTEIALNGGEIPDNRGQMNFRADKELIDFMTKLGELRNQLPSLTRGTMEMLYDQDGMAIYKREYEGKTSIIAINNTRKSQKVTLTSEQLEGGKELRGLLSGDIVRSRENQYILILDRDNAEVYVQTEKSGLNLPLIVSLIVVYLLVIVFLFFIIKRRKRNNVS